jgi:hypothetical protein
MKDRVAFSFSFFGPSAKGDWLKAPNDLKISWPNTSNVRLGSKADVRQAVAYVCLVPEADILPVTGRARVY